MNLFEAMLVGHLAGDYILQNRWMALNKEKRIGPLAVHSAVYAACVAAFALPVQTLPMGGILLIFISHMVLDRRSLVRWWMREVNGIEAGSPEEPFLKIAIDQGFHIIILALVAYASMLGFIAPA